MADDDPSCSAQLRAALAGGNFRVYDARDGDAALLVARRERPALAFLDWDMPGRSGAEVCRAMRADENTAPTRIVAVTGRSEARERHRLLAAGADDFITKPFSPLQVLYKVRDHLGPEALPY